MYKHITETWQKIWKEKYGNIKERAIQWRKEPTLVRVETPTRIDRARRLGFKSNKGMVTVRIRLSRGGMRRLRPKSGRRSKHLGVTRIKGHINPYDVAKRRVVEKYPNLNVKGSYLLYQDGKYSWYEVILSP